MSVLALAAHTLLYMLQCCNFEPCMRHTCVHIDCRLSQMRGWLIIAGSSSCEQRVQYCDVYGLMCHMRVLRCDATHGWQPTPHSLQASAAGCWCLLAATDSIHTHIPPPLPLQELRGCAGRQPQHPIADRSADSLRGFIQCLFLLRLCVKPRVHACMYVHGVSLAVCVCVCQSAQQEVID